MVGGGTADNANDPWRWEKGKTSVDRRATSVKSCEAEHCAHPKPIGREVGDKCEIMQAENPEYSGRQLWETSGRQVRNHAAQSSQSIQTGLGDKRGTSLKSCGQRNQCRRRQVGDKCEIRPATALRASRVYQEKNERQVRDKCEIMRTKALRASRVYWETNKWATSGDKWETNLKSCGARESRV